MFILQIIERDHDSQVYSSMVRMFPRRPLFFESEEDVKQFLENNGFEKVYFEKIYSTPMENYKSKVAWYYDEDVLADSEEWAWNEGHCE